LLPQRSKHPREMVITPKASTSIFEAVRYSGIQQIQLDTARYVRIQLDTLGYSGITVDLLQNGWI